MVASAARSGVGTLPGLTEPTGWETSRVKPREDYPMIVVGCDAGSSRWEGSGWSTPIRTLRGGCLLLGLVVSPVI